MLVSSLPDHAARELDALRAQCEQLGERALRAEQQVHALRAEQSAFAERIGHELRNPLNGLCAALEVLQGCAHPHPDAAAALDVATRQARRIVERVDELLPRTGGMRRGG